MGGNESKPKPLQVATLNFAGIAHSPFEFYIGNQQQQKELEQLSKIFEVLYEKEIKNQKKLAQKAGSLKPGYDISSWKLSNLQKCMQRERYSPLYRRDAGIMNGHLMKRAEFENKWEQQFHKNHHYVKFNSLPTQEEKYHCKVFDYLVFKTFVEFIYVNRVGRTDEVQTEDRGKKQEEPEEDWKQRRKLAVVRYQAFLDYHFSKPYLKPDNKLKRLKQVLEKNDIVFLQDASDQLLNALRNEGNVNIITAMRVDCAILLKQGDKFKHLYDQKRIMENYKNFKQKHQQVLNPKKFRYQPSNKQEVTTVVCFVDNLMLINIHLGSAKGCTQKEKILEVMSHFIQLKQTFPTVNIIAGGDFNTFFIREREDQNKKENEDRKEKKKEDEKTIITKFYSIFKVYPDKQEILTTKKKRTQLQSQNKKADKQDMSCRDFIISDLELKNAKTQVLGQILLQNQNMKLQTEQHPFDHVIVSATLER